MPSHSSSWRSASSRLDVLGVDPADLDLRVVVERRRGGAPRSPTGRRPRAGCTCRPSRCAPTSAAASPRLTSASHSREVGGRAPRCRSGRGPGRRRPRRGSRAGPCRSSRRRAPRRPPRPAGWRTGRSSRGSRATSAPSERQTSMSGWMPIRRSSWTECWVGLVLSSPAWPRNGTSVRCTNMRPVAAVVDLELAQRLEERQRLDVADRAADLGDHEVHVLRLGHEPDPVLDLVGDVRDHLHGAAEVVAAALAPDHRVVDRAGGDVRAARGVGVGEALVVAEVEVGLRAVLGHEDLAVLERAHRARVHVDVRIELLEGDAEAARDQQAADGGGGDALAECRHDSPGDEDEAGLRTGVRHASPSERV